MSAAAIPCERLMQALSTLTLAMQAAQPEGAHAARWSRAALHLQQELGRLRSLSRPGAATAGSSVPSHAALKATATRLTQLARMQDGLPLNHAGSAEQLLGQRRSVVFAAWHLMQALEQSAPASAQRPAP